MPKNAKRYFKFLKPSSKDKLSELRIDSFVFEENFNKNIEGNR